MKATSDGETYGMVTVGNTCAWVEGAPELAAAINKLVDDERKQLVDLLRRARAYVAKPIPHFSTPSKSALFLLERIDAELAKENGQ